ncbi:MAG: hypothetical protein HYZ43_01300 [Flavobacteriia bacterium]|jgi:hypothetical protein|nr:hypothetical protein [Flavobacteriia bacterium]
MTDVIAFLDQFKRERNFTSVLPQMNEFPEFRSALLHQIERNVYPYSEYASWIAQHFFKAYPQYFEEWVPFFKSIVLQTPNHSIQRNVTHLFMDKKVSIEEDGELLDHFLKAFASSDSLPALKMTSFKAIERQYFKAYPELIHEVALIMELHKEDKRPSVQSIRRYFYKKYTTHLNN